MFISLSICLAVRSRRWQQGGQWLGLLLSLYLVVRKCHESSEGNEKPKQSHHCNWNPEVYRGYNYCEDSSDTVQSCMVYDGNS